MKLYTPLLALLIAICALAAASMLLPESDGARGSDHPEYSNMKHGGAGFEKHADRLWLNWAFGVLTLLVFVTLIAIGARKGRDLRGLGWWLASTAVGSIVAWSALVLSYSRYMTAQSPTLFLAMPGPSAIMLYGLLPVTALLTAFYVVGFHRWILTEEALSEYDRMLEEKNSVSADESHH
jgi:uncharacterized membrane protein YhaH (DUF805 family)